MSAPTITSAFNLDDLIFPTWKVKERSKSLTSVLKMNLRMQGFRVFSGPFAIKYRGDKIEEVLIRERDKYVPSSEHEYLSWIDNLREKVSRSYRP